ncbi:hypothetical protein [Muriicola sp. Z0-33]|uniref:hypothetical protein n=1 Tax=Muriicola sp. Z0-33 TaxID=2816957 RepID=UPI002238484F|nr:hypothetical protein [Muriicola sp. Z0-33]MCW5517431.1 hypothetical protein [Muriicola sp. Z0-33]
MRTSIKTILVSSICILFVALSCSKDDDEELTKDGAFSISELAGNWDATRASFSGNSANIDVVADGGSVTMSVRSSGRFTLTIDPVDRAAYTVSGEMFWEKFEGNSFFAIVWDDYPGDWDTYGATLTATTFDLNGGFDSAEYDFDNDGTFESASISMTFTRS